MRCPYCGSAVEPLRDAAGQLVCPACHNTGVVAAPAGPPGPPGFPPAPTPAASAVYGAYPYPSYAAPPAGPTSGKAIAALVLGICSIVLYPLAIILAPIAIVLGVKGLREARGPPPRPGKGMAIAGITTGGVGAVVGVTVVLAAVVFILVSDLGEDEAWDFEVDDGGQGGVLTVSGYPGFPSWDEFALGGDADCRLPFGDVDYGDEIVCSTDGSVLLLDAATGNAVYTAEV